MACEMTGAIRDSLHAKGFTGAWSCDILPSETSSRHHIQNDVRPLLSERWDMVIAHPPCQYLAASGLAHWNLPGRDKKRREAVEFFHLCLNANAPWVAVENPRMPLCRLGGQIRPSDQCVQPWQFGHNFTKATCFWLKGLPKLVPSHTHVRPLCPRQWTDHEQRDPARRARTFPGIAEAIAEQWGGYMAQFPPVPQRQAA